LDKALCADDAKLPTPVEQFAANIISDAIWHGNKTESPTQYRGLKTGPNDSDVVTVEWSKLNHYEIVRD
jgi:hypothetical protein